MATSTALGATVRRARVAEVRSLGAGYAIVALDDPEAPPARPGQFLMMRGDWGTAPLLPRPMSLLTDRPRTEVLIKVVGEGTRRFREAAPGAVIEVTGPLGSAFEDPPPGTRAVLVAGGVGVAPLWFLAEQWRARGLQRPVFLYGGRTAADLPGSERLEAITQLVVTTEDGSRGTPGRVTVALQALCGPGTIVYACGPDRMMAAVARMAAQGGSRCTVSLEAPMACGFGVCLGCAVPRASGGFCYVCVEGPVVDAASIDWGADG